MERSARGKSLVPPVHLLHSHWQCIQGGPNPHPAPEHKGAPEMDPANSCLIGLRKGNKGPLLGPSSKVESQLLMVE